MKSTLSFGYQSPIFAHSVRRSVCKPVFSSKAYFILRSRRPRAVRVPASSNLRRPGSGAFVRPFVRSSVRNDPKRKKNGPKRSETPKKRSETVQNDPLTVRNGTKTYENGPKMSPATFRRILADVRDLGLFYSRSDQIPGRLSKFFEKWRLDFGYDDMMI